MKKVHLIIIVLFFIGSCNKEKIENKKFSKQLEQTWRLYSYKYQNREYYDSSYINLLTFESNNKAIDDYETEKYNLKWQILSNVLDNNTNKQIHLTYVGDLESEATGVWEIIKLTDSHLELRKYEPSADSPKCNWIKYYTKN